MSEFKEKNNIEQEFYDKYFSVYLKSKNYNVIFIRYTEQENSIYNKLQKLDDIDVIVDDGKKNISFSLKTVIPVYQNIFFETISNCSKDTPGWGFYSKADYIIYTWGFPENMRTISFKCADVLKLELKKYNTGYGYTHDVNGNLLYKTEGQLVPCKDFPHKEINLS
jgi:hypothetical protein